MPLDLTQRYVNKLAQRVADSVSFEKVTRIEDVIPEGIGRTAINVRIPFCAFKCTYCALPGQSYDERQANIFLAAVQEELRLYSYYLKKPRIDRLYISGGTPSLMHEKLEFLGQLVEESFNKPPVIAMEASPADLTPEVLENLRKAGISQISIGVQTFDEQVLRKQLGRNITKDKMVEVLRQVMSAGFDYVNIDLMFSMPGQTKETLAKDLEIAADLGVHGVSTYPLMLLEYTQMTKKVRRDNASKGNEIALQDPIQEKEQYQQILDSLRPHGYKMRAIWSFSKKPEAYEGPYEHSQFVGIGPRAWGMLGSSLTLNTSNIFDYLARLEEGFLPLYAYSPIRAHATGSFARCLYRGSISKAEVRELAEEDSKISRYVHLMRLLGLVRDEGEHLVLTDKALALGSSATKRIAMATLEKTNAMIRESAASAKEEGQEPMAQQEFVALS
ncbi:MAG TPA: radical SAM protein [Methanomassiliicoccales archaeon]|nr:radical SAM protein [Methanomassiliicoccales archaeon]